MSYPGTINFPNEGESLEDTAAKIESSSAAEVKTRLTAGLERRGDSETYSAAQFLEREPKSPVVEPPRGGASVPSRYVHSDRVSMAHDQVREAHRRPVWHSLGTPEPVAEAWELVLEALAEAKDAMAAIPAVMLKAERDRAALLADADAPTVLPSPGDARAWAEEQALAAINAARSARVEYDRAVEENLEDHAANLAATVPAEVEAIRERVVGLKADLERLREGVAAVADVASARAQGQRGKSLPTPTRLDVLDGLEEELAALQAVADEPTEVALVPSLRDREMIARQAHQVVGGISASIVDLARREKAEEYKHTSYTRGIPQHVLDNAESRAKYGV